MRLRDAANASWQQGPDEIRSAYLNYDVNDAAGQADAGQGVDVLLLFGCPVFVWLALQSQGNDSHVVIPIAGMVAWAVKEDI